MNRHRHPTSHWAVVALALAAAGCVGCDDDPPAGVIDAGIETAPPMDANDEGSVVAPSIDFTVIGCPSYDGSIPRCTGPAPLTVSFAPITTGNVTRLLWDFGDQTTSSDSLPTHTYTLPDSYDVTLLGAPGLTSPPRPGFIQVTANPLGGACDITPQCELPMSCLCGETSECPTAFARGVCTVSCAQAACPAGAICADLGRGLTAPEKQPWREPSCLRACASDAACAPGQRCRFLPITNNGTSSWGRACFFDFPADPGAACRGPGGDVQDAVCLGGRCADLGARGICSVDCSASACPSGTACAHFADGRQLCLPRCNPSLPCGDDPLLACSTPGGVGPLAFTIPVPPVDPPPDAGVADAGAPDAPVTMTDAAPDAAAPTGPITVCSAKRCTSDTNCLPAGTCKDAPNGHCVPRL
ncbi:MAG TPA: PKD domain-containing protein [Polyangia bacterium]